MRVHMNRGGRWVAGGERWRRGQPGVQCALHGTHRAGQRQRRYALARAQKAPATSGNQSHAHGGLHAAVPICDGRRHRHDPPRLPRCSGCWRYSRKAVLLCSLPFPFAVPAPTTWPHARSGCGCCHDLLCLRCPPHFGTSYMCMCVCVYAIPAPLRPWHNAVITVSITVSRSPPCSPVLYVVSFSLVISHCVCDGPLAPCPPAYM